MIVSLLVPLLVSLVSQIEKSRLEKHTQTRPEGALVFGTPLTLFAWDAVKAGNGDGECVEGQTALGSRWCEKLGRET